MCRTPLPPIFRLKCHREQSSSIRTCIQGEEFRVGLKQEFLRSYRRSCRPSFDLECDSPIGTPRNSSGIPVSIGFAIGLDACKNAWHSKPLVYRPIHLERDPSSERAVNAIRERVSRVSGVRSPSSAAVRRGFPTREGRVVRDCTFLRTRPRATLECREITFVNPD